MNPVTKEQIVLAEQQLADAMKSHDIIILDKLLHNNLLFHTPDGNIITKDIDLNAHRSGSMVIESLSASEQQISLFGDTAVASVLIETKGKMLGNAIEGRFRYIRTWKLFDDELKVIGGSCIQVF